MAPRFVAADYGASPFKEDASFLRAAEWLGKDEREFDAALVGVPFSALSLSGARCDLAPSAIRRAMWSFSPYTEEVDLSYLRTKDFGDVIVRARSPSASLAKIGDALGEIPDVPLVIFGGDNSITAPAMLARVGAGGGLLTLDAHHDVRDYQKSGLSNGSPVRYLLDEGLDGGRIWQLGIRGFANSGEYSAFARKSGIKSIPAQEIHSKGVNTFVQRALAELSASDGIYVDLDIDVVDRALAPGAPGALPGGLFPQHVFQAAFMCGKHPQVKAIDIVEVDPERDLAETTVRLAALAALYFWAGVAVRSHVSPDMVAKSKGRG